MGRRPLRRMRLRALPATQPGWNPEMSGGVPSGTKSIAHYTHASTHVDTRNNDGSRRRCRKVANLRVLHAKTWTLWLLCV